MKFLDRFKDKKVLGFFDADLDGVGCRIVAELFIKPITEEWFVYNSAERDMSEFPTNYADKADVVLFADITPTIELYKDLIKKGKEVIICDHHVTAYQELSLDIPEEDYYYDTERCGTRILYDNCTKDTRRKKAIYQFVELVDIYDKFIDESTLWKRAVSVHLSLMEVIPWFKVKEDPTAKDEHYAKYVERQIYKFTKMKARNFYFTNMEDQLIVKGWGKIDRAYKQAVKSIKKRVDNSGNTYVFLECDSKISFVSNRILKEQEDIQYMVVRSRYNKDSGKVSLRSSKGSGFDVSAIAKAWADKSITAGGHPNSSGIELYLEDFNKLKAGSLHLI